MRQILQILTRALEQSEADLLAAQDKLPDHQIHRFDLSQPNPNYDLLLEKIFEADCIQCF